MYKRQPLKYSGELTALQHVEEETPLKYAEKETPLEYAGELMALQQPQKYAEKEMPLQHAEEREPSDDARTYGLLQYVEKSTPLHHVDKRQLRFLLCIVHPLDGIVNILIKAFHIRLLMKSIPFFERNDTVVQPNFYCINIVLPDTLMQVFVCLQILKQ